MESKLVAPSASAVSCVEEITGAIVENVHPVEVFDMSMAAGDDGTGCPNDNELCDCPLT